MSAFNMCARAFCRRSLSLLLTRNTKPISNVNLQARETIQLFRFNSRITSYRFLSKSPENLETETQFSDTDWDVTVKGLLDMLEEKGNVNIMSNGYNRRIKSNLMQILRDDNVDIPQAESLYNSISMSSLSENEKEVFSSIMLRIYLSGMEVDKAVKLWNKRIEEDPEHENRLFQAIYIYKKFLQLERLNDAENFFNSYGEEHLKKLSTDHIISEIRPVIVRSIIGMCRDGFVISVSDAHRALKTLMTWCRQPGVPLRLFLGGYLDRGDWEAAVECYCITAEEYKRPTLLFIRLLTLLIENGQEKGLREVIKKSATLQSRHLSHMGLTLAFVCAGKREAAEQLYKNLIEEKQESVQCLKTLFKSSLVDNNPRYMEEIFNFITEKYAQDAEEILEFALSSLMHSKTQIVASFDKSGNLYKTALKLNLL